jgi:hypothetical protein
MNEPGYLRAMLREIYKERVAISHLIIAFILYLAIFSAAIITASSVEEKSEQHKAQQIEQVQTWLEKRKQ